MTRDTPAARAIAEATRDYQQAPDATTEAVALRIRHLRPGKPYAESSWIGRYHRDDAHAIADRLVTALKGWVYDETPYAVTVAHIDGELLSMRQAAQRAGLAESSIRTYRTRGLVPEPDMMIGSTPGWWPSTIDAWIATLPGQGARTDLRSTG